ncbi:MAG: alpha-E domain-containing protein [Chloroflexi bacterium]|nr:alpha-E domain-containing protein [Chloroflexota bacterium]
MLSRVADSLYWMSRYLERAENTARLIDVYMNISLDVPDAYERERVRRLQQAFSIEPADEPDVDKLLQQLTFDATLGPSIIANITHARENARQVREQISSEMWTQINTLYLDVRYAKVDGIWQDAPHSFYNKVKEGSHLFQGITDATMNHNQGWHFIQLGRSIERVINLLRLMSVHFDDHVLTTHIDFATTRYFELVSVLKSVSAFEAYCKVYNANLQTGWITEFLLFNREFPRSLRFGVDKIQASLTTIADLTGRNKGTRLYRLAGRLQSMLSYDELGDIGDLHDYLDAVTEQIAEIHNLLFDTFITYSIDTAL